MEKVTNGMNPVSLFEHKAAHRIVQNFQPSYVVMYYENYIENNVKFPVPESDPVDDEISDDDVMMVQHELGFDTLFGMIDIEIDPDVTMYSEITNTELYSAISMLVDEISLGVFELEDDGDE